MNYGFFLGAAIFVIIVIAIKWRRNLPKTLLELRAFAFLMVISEGRYNQHGANNIANSTSKNDLIRLAPLMNQAIREEFDDNPEQMIAHAVSLGYKPEK